VVLPSRRGSSFPLALVVTLSGLAMLALVTVAIMRTRRAPGGSVVVLGDEPPRPFDDYSILRVWHDIEGSFRRVDPEEQQERKRTADGRRRRSDRRRGRGAGTDDA
jgi:hypothetical protein